MPGPFECPRRQSHVMAMKLKTFMDSHNKNLGSVPNVPGPVPAQSSPSPAPLHTLPPNWRPTSPPPLMSIKSFPELPSEMTSPPRKSRKKDRKYDIDSHSRFLNNIFETQAQNWPRFYLMSKKEGNFSNMSPFLYCDLIIKSIGKPKSVQKMASGVLNIEAANEAQAKLIKELKKLGDYEIIVEQNQRLNTSKGVIVCRDFMVCTEEEIRIGMADQGVIDVRRINRRQGGTLVATASLILTFDKPNPPEQIEAAFYKLKVRKYIPSPMRCFKCLKFGHTSYRCRSTGQMCACGLFVHEDKPCQEPPVCVNCADLHSSRSPECSIYKEEKEIQKVKTLQNVPYREAKELVRSKYVTRPNISYAAATKATPVERKDWQKLIQPFIFSGSQGPSRPVWATQETNKNLLPPPIRPTGVEVSSSPLDQDTLLAPLPAPLPAASAAGRRAPALPVRSSSSRLPPRSPPRKERQIRQVLASKPVPGPLSEAPMKEDRITVSPRNNSDPLPPRSDAINWVSSREEHGSDSETGDSNRTVLTDTGPTPMERPVVRRKRKGMSKISKK